MKLYNIKDIEGFFALLDSCHGKVELVTDEGDRINLKSKISQYFSLAQAFSDGVLDEIEIVAHEPDDAVKILDYMMKG